MANQSQKKKLCWNCEGTVSFHEETCPYCGVSVIPAFLEGAGADFSPPYTKFHEPDLEIPKSPYELHSSQEEGKTIDSQAVKKEEETPASDAFRSSMTAIALLLSGSVFLLFSFVLALFSKKGVLTLQWDGTVWYVYLIAGLPLLLLGWKSLMKID